MDNTIATMKNILMGCAVGLALSATIAFVSCADDMDMSGNPNALKIEVEDAWTAQAGTRVAYSQDGIHTEFQEGDAIGVYAFDGTTMKANNVKFTMQSDGTWVGASTLDYNKNYTYYAYFPYNASLPYTPTTSGSVDTRFATFINDASSVFWKADQSTKANFDQSNLMIAEGTTTTAPRVKFVMNHKRGLVLINPLNKWYYSSDTNTKYSVSVIYNGNIPYSGNVVYTGEEPYSESSGYSLFLTKPSVATNVAGQSVTISEGKYVLINGIGASGTPTYTYSTSDDGGSTWSSYSSTKPSWLTVTKVTQTNAPLNFSVTTTAPTIETAGQKKVDTELQARTSVSNRDLSMVDNAGNARSSRTTANCYLVHAPGTYRIPLVYGNAIKNGATNSSAYHTTETSSNVLQNFVNHNDVAIYTGNDAKDPWIKNHSITVNGAKLIWQDMKGMISKVGISGDYLTFTVDKDHIAEGNAVISATASGTVVWSWHIWVTKQTLSTTTAVNTGSHTYNVADVNLGAVDAAFYKPRARVRATANGVTMQFEVEQINKFTGEGNDAQHSLINTYYQWGRSVSEPPATTSNLYNIDGSQFTFGSSSASSIGTTIRNPDTHHYNSSSYGPYNVSKYNYWDANNTIKMSTRNTATVKTIYDPCPPGYCIPTNGLYIYMGSNSSSTMWITYENGGPGRTWAKDTPNIFFPASGYRNISNGSLSYFGSYGYYWSGTPIGSNGGCRLYFGSSNFYQSSSYRAYGFPVRPVRVE